MQNRSRGLFAIAVSLAFGQPGALYGQAGPAVALERVGTGLSLPVAAVASPGQTNYLFVLEQHTGRIRVLDLGTRSVLTEPFLTVSNVTKGNEQGLLGLAFHPNYSSNGFFYVNYTTTGGGAAGHTEVTRYRVQGDPAASVVADPTSQQVVLSFDQPEANHNGGWLGFGPDGYLYISAGDGGGGNDQHGAIGNGQSLNTLLGKILRIDVDQGDPYRVPDDNPFKSDSDKRGEIWAFGLRNPWRCSFDRVTGDLWIGDVGQGAREEVDFAPAGVGGLNFGWRPREGSLQNNAYPSEKPVTPATEPVHDYARSLGYSIIGGFRYRGTAIPDLQGSYLFGDYGSGRIWALTLNGTNAATVVDWTSQLKAPEGQGLDQLSSFGEDNQGELYLCDLGDGEVYKLVSTGSQTDSINLTVPSLTDGAFVFQFQPAAGQGYVVESRPSLGLGTWQTVTNLSPTTSANVLSITNSIGASQQYFRVRTQ